MNKLILGILILGQTACVALGDSIVDEQARLTCEEELRGNPSQITSLDCYNNIKAYQKKREIQRQKGYKSE